MSFFDIKKIYPIGGGAYGYTSANGTRHEIGKGSWILFDNELYAHPIDNIDNNSVYYHWAEDNTSCKENINEVQAIFPGWAKFFSRLEIKCPLEFSNLIDFYQFNEKLISIIAYAKELEEDAYKKHGCEAEIGQLIFSVPRVDDVSVSYVLTVKRDKYVLYIYRED